MVILSGFVIKKELDLRAIKVDIREVFLLLGSSGRAGSRLKENGSWLF